MSRPLLLSMMGGLGDGIYQRPLVRHLLSGRGAGVYGKTPYPELYEDLPAFRPVEWRGSLRCQAKNMARFNRWSNPPEPYDRARVIYKLRDIRRSIVEEMEVEARAAIARFVFDLPDFGPPPVKAARFALVRPVSIRTEWPATARNPRPEYVQAAALELKRQGFRVVCVADIDGDAELLDGEMPEADDYFVHGEFTPRQLLALVKHASVVVGPVGWIVPAALAYRTPAVIIGGGLGAHNAPELLVDRRMDASRFRLLLPRPYCRCRDHRHSCPKRIPDFDQQFRDALTQVTA